MNTLEKEIIKIVIDRLKISTTKNWDKSGDIEKWYNYAVRMHNDIHYSLSILKTLNNIESGEEDKNKLIE